MMRNDSAIKLSWVIHSLSKHKGKILILACLVYAAIGVAFYRVAPRYTSLSKWISMPESPGLAGLQGIGSLLGAGIPSSGDDFANYEDIINSTEFLAPILDKRAYLTLKGDSVPVREVLDMKKFLKGGDAPDAAPSTRVQEMARKEGLVGRLRGSINFLTRSPVYQLRIQSWDPGLAQSLNYLIIERAKEYNAKERQGKSKRKRRFLGEQLESFKAALKKSEDNLVAFQQQNISVQNPALVVQRERLAREVAVNSQLVMEFRKQFELTRAEEDNEAVEIGVIEAPSFAFSKNYPTPKLFFGAGLFAALMLAGFFFLAVEFLGKAWSDSQKGV